MKIDVKVCRVCSVDLAVGENWSPGMFKLSNYLCKNCNIKKSQEYIKNNREKVLHKKRIYSRLSYIKNKKRISAWHREYASNNKGKRNALEAKRRAAKLHRTPKWADLKAIREFYINCPNGMAVDHIVPLQGKEVSGFHILENLQYLTPSENSKKGNSFDIKGVENEKN